MDQRKTKAFFEGRDIHAYNIFGAHLEANGVRFRVYAPNAKNISVIGTFNDNEQIAMLSIPKETVKGTGMFCRRCKG